MAEIRVTLERACQSFATRQRTSEPKPSGAPKGLVIGVFSPKGGVGKTTIATNIAVGLGKIAPMSVVIVDLDLQFGNVAWGLYLNPEHTVTDAVTPSASQDSLVLQGFSLCVRRASTPFVRLRTPLKQIKLPGAGGAAAGATCRRVSVRGG